MRPPGSWIEGPWRRSNGIISPIVSGDAVALGAIPALSGNLRVQSGFTMSERNVANTADFNVFSGIESNFFFGDAAGTSTLTIACANNGALAALGITGLNWNSGAVALFLETTLKTHAAFAGSELRWRSGAVQTGGAVATEVTGARITLADNKAYFIGAFIIGRGTANVERAMYGRIGLFFRAGGGSTLQGAVQDIMPLVETSAGLNGDVVVVAASNDVRVEVTGLAATTINWACWMFYMGVSGNA